jgi:CBS domain-containing protein
MDGVRPGGSCALAQLLRMRRRARGPVSDGMRRAPVTKEKEPSMSLSQFTRRVVTANANESVERAACIMRDQGVGCLVVTGEGRPHGIVTDRDLVLRVLAEGVDASTPVGDFTTYGPFTVSVHDTIETASTRMREHGVRRLPIVDDTGKVVGIVTADDLLMAFGRGLADVCEGIENRSDSVDVV